MYSIRVPKTTSFIRTEKQKAQKDIAQVFVTETAQVLVSKIVYNISTNEVSKSKLLSWHTVSLVSDSQSGCILKMKVKSDHRSKVSNLSHWKEEA